MKTFDILIATRNRKMELAATLAKVLPLLGADVACTVYDDGSDDGTFQMVKDSFPGVALLRNEQSKGYLYCRNWLLNHTGADIAISLDDDAEFLTDEPLAIIAAHFENYPRCGVLAFRIFWGTEEPHFRECTDGPKKVKSFVGCGHAWRMEAWREIPDYPQWFQFYGEEAVASMDLYAKGREVWYVPGILVWHRVNLLARSRSVGDWGDRQRKSLRSGWYRYGLLLPANKIGRYLGSSLLAQFRKILLGKPQLILPLAGAIMDLVRHLPEIRSQRRPMTPLEFERYSNLPEAEIYWKPREK